MLKSQQESAEQSPPLSVAQARVTPEELSQALAAIEARKQAEASRLAGTIPIEEAVSSLHLDSTPDEIWAEVQAQRAKAEAERTPAVNPTFAAANAARREQLHQQPGHSSAVQTPTTLPQRRQSRRWMGIFTPFFLIWLLAQAGVIPQFWNHHQRLLPAAQHTPHVAQMTTLAQVPDGKEVYADSAALIQLSESKPLSQISIDLSQTDNGWKIFKMGGRIYLHGYILNTESLQPLTGKPLNVYNDDNSGELEGEKTSQITLRVDKVSLQRSGGDNIIPNLQCRPFSQTR